MGQKSSIEWTNASWNPTRGCSMAKGSENGGCLNCYAARMASRNLPGMKSPTTGKTFARILQSGPRWTGDVELIENALDLPLKWRAPKRIFVNSMSDLFHEALPDEAIDRVFAIMALCPQHTFQCLTKRPGRMLAYFMKGMAHMDARRRVQDVLVDMGHSLRANKLIEQWPLPNVWLGISCEDQKTANARIPLLLQTPAAIRFVSYEPAIGPVDFDAIPVTVAPGFFGSPLQWHHRGRCHQEDMENVAYPTLSLIIIGGESGPGARPFDIEWARQMITQCRDAGVKCFVKQLGRVPMMAESKWRDQLDATGKVRLLNPLNARHMPNGFVPLAMHDRKGGDMEEWPDDLRVRQLPGQPHK